MFAERPMRRLERQSPLNRRLQAFAGDADGATAVEFAFVVGPFLLMMFAVIELALVFLLSTSLDAASDKTARRIRTGEFQTAGETAAQFKQGICDRMTWLAGNCLTALVVDVRTYPTFGNISDPVLTTSTTQPGKKTYNPGAAQFNPTPPPQQIVVVRSYYSWPLISPFYNQALARTDGSATDALVTSTQVFRTEPYQP